LSGATSARAAIGLGILIGLGALAPAASADELEMYTATVDAAQVEELAAGGYDVASVQPESTRAQVDLVLTDAERSALASREGIRTSPLVGPDGLTATQRAAKQARGGFEVYRDYDSKGGIEDELRRFAKRNADIAELHVLGQSLQGRDILAIRLTDDVADQPVGSRPAVLYQGTTHAREWISTEVSRRLMHWFADPTGPGSGAAEKMVKRRELWFIPVVNPDGYQYTFDSERLWRKNLRDNDGDGEITVYDGVDINRNYPEHWNYDDEGSSSDGTSDTYRGTGPASEPETVANMSLFDQVDFAFAISYHSYGPLLLYPEGWQVQTPSRDDPIYIALTGTDEEPAVKGFDPDVSAELYTTNGEFTDWAHGDKGVLSWTPELQQGCKGCGFVFPDDEDLVQGQFEKNRAFALDVARSAANPDDPKSHLGNETEPFYLETVSADPERANNPLSDLRFAHSFGDPQPVEVLAKRELGDVTVHYSVNGGDEQTAPTSEWTGGENYGDRYSVHYHLMRGEVTGTDPGDTVEVWFEAGGERSDSFTYRAVSESGAGTLVVAAEDYSGISTSPPYPNTVRANYLRYFERALEDLDVPYEVYDIDARDRTAPDHLGVLSHFDSVVWFTGNDVVTREPGMVPGTASRLANDQMLEMRAYLNEGGKLLYNGQYAGFGYAFAYSYDPVANAACFAGDQEVNRRCLPLSDDFLQYDLGAYIYNDDAGTDHDTAQPFDVTGVGDPFAGGTWGINGPASADNQAHTASFLSTSSLLPEGDYPQFASDAPAQWAREGSAPFEPYDGSSYVYSNRANQTYKRLSRTIDLGALNEGDPASLGFRISYDTEPAWDFVMVEAHTVGEDDWTTLPDVNDHTDTDTGDSCPEGWIEDIHPFLAHYQTRNPDATCEPTGTTGEWNAASGRSAGWEEWDVDLSDYAGDQVEVSITFVSDYAVQGLGAFVDEVEVSTGEGTTSFEDDADPLDGWTVPGEPEGSPDNPNDWERRGSVGFEEGAVVSTDDTLYLGFGLEGVATREERADLLGRSLDFLAGAP
jgi:Zinc carboxypeptidase